MGRRFLIQPHAVERYLKRCNPSATYPEARAHLEAASEKAIRMRNPTPKGDAQYEIQDAVLVVKHDHLLRQQVVVTVLEKPEQPDVLVIHTDEPESLPLCAGCRLQGCNRACGICGCSCGVHIDGGRCLGAGCKKACKQFVSKAVVERLSLKDVARLRGEPPPAPAFPSVVTVPPGTLKTVERWLERAVTPASPPRVDLMAARPLGSAVNAEVAQRHDPLPEIMARCLALTPARMVSTFPEPPSVHEARLRREQLAAEYHALNVDIAVIKDVPNAVHAYQKAVARATSLQPELSFLKNWLKAHAAVEAPVRPSREEQSWEEQHTDIGGIDPEMLRSGIYDALGQLSALLGPDNGLPEEKALGQALRAHFKRLGLSKSTRKTRIQLVRAAGIGAPRLVPGSCEDCGDPVVGRTLCDGCVLERRSAKAGGA